MPTFCQYLNCQNLGSSTYDGYCTQDHQRRGPESKFLLKIVETHKDISTLKDARIHWSTLTSSFHCEVCKELLRESGVYQAR